MILAQETAENLGHNYIAPEHIVIAIAGEGAGDAARVLRDLGVTKSALIDRVRETMPPSDGHSEGEHFFTPAAKRGIERAFNEARDRDNNYISCEHLLLGMLREYPGNSDGIFAEFAITYDAVTERLRDSMPRGRMPGTEPDRESAGPFRTIDHIQLAMPAGQEQIARMFYVGILGMQELPKPAHLAARGGAWFASGPVQVHLGVDADFHPATKAHPALKCRDYRTLIGELREKAVPVEEVPRGDDETERAYIADPFGNRIELVGDAT
ncbi:MAG TPA: Clp protease N-terminal domain-containing protein [Candidatus Baltobacteraceae bacterium]|jgi:hypothetical protein|nr:Clp protease N-terminal domain-containing protein [Candidatus Baltobacteraceae bacterium]